jgi:hypothetical protein
VGEKGVVWSQPMAVYINLCYLPLSFSNGTMRKNRTLSALKTKIEISQCGATHRPSLRFNGTVQIADTGGQAHDVPPPMCPTPTLNLRVAVPWRVSLKDDPIFERAETSMGFVGLCCTKHVPAGGSAVWLPRVLGRIMPRNLGPEQRISRPPFGWAYCEVHGCIATWARWVPFSSFTRMFERLYLVVAKQQRNKTQLAFGICRSSEPPPAAAGHRPSALAADAPHLLERPLLMSFDSMTCFQVLGQWN